MQHFIALLALAAATLFGQKHPEIKGVTGAEVLIEDLDTGSVRLGLSPESIRTDVELRLRAVGFSVLSAAIPPIHSYVDVTITTTGDSQAAMIHVMFAEIAKTIRMPVITALAITSIRSMVLSKPTSDGVRSAVKDCVDDFLNGWVGANPRASLDSTAHQEIPAASLAKHHE